MTARPDLKALFRDHLEGLTKTTDQALEECGFDRLLITAGTPFRYYSDDVDAPFVPTPHFNHWVPTESPHHVLCIEAGTKPKLIFYYPADFWHEQQALPNSYWTSHFEIVQVDEIDAIAKQVPNPSGKKVAFIGPDSASTNAIEAERNPSALVTQLDWYRGYKSDYEIACISEAQLAASEPHRKAKELFFDGASEYEILQAYISETGLRAQELPYHPIIGLDEKAAILHYHNARTTKPGRVLLIDAGSRFERFGSDITRTYCTDNTPDTFKQLLEGMNKLQQAICAEATPGRSIADLHVGAHQKVSQLLVDTDVVKGLSAAEVLEKGISRVFLPHGLGHLLGIQVHDVGGHQTDRHGKTQAPPKEFPKLRSTRTLEDRMVFTIEPGLYFIPMLLEPQRQNEHSKHFNWSLIDELIGCGGIRVEDDIVVTPNGSRNLTREISEVFNNEP